MSCVCPVSKGGLCVSCRPHVLCCVSSMSCVCVCPVGVPCVVSRVVCMLSYVCVVSMSVACLCVVHLACGVSVCV